ncbi:MAG: alkaline phosphatase family protein [Acidobacteriota bacterium]|nr:alkaline phosphatase family protein [Acidobacteriota bacterium]
MLSSAALLDGAHASYYAYFLPPGINDRLIKTAVWLAAGALIAFYTALLHSLERRRYGWRSRYGLLLLALLSVLAMVERRAAFHPRPAAVPRPAVVEAAERPQLWVIGLDTATLDAILPLAGQGRLPFLARMIQGGAYGRLDSFSPGRPASLWMTLATGRYPYQHGVTGGPVFGADHIAHGSELNLLPVGIGFERWGLLGSGGRLPQSYTRGALALWEVLPRLGISAGMAGWPASSPAGNEDVFVLSDRFFLVRPEPDSAWPRELAKRPDALRPDLRQVGATIRSAFGPMPSKGVADAFTGDLWRESALSSLLAEHSNPGAVLLVLPGLRHVSRRYFGGFDAVQFRGRQAHDAEEAAELIATYYARLDQYLGELWDRGKGPRVLAVVSAFGIEGSFGWRRLLGEVSRPSALEGFFDDAPDGALLLYGEGIRPGTLITGAKIVDLAPTLLYALDCPVASDLDGQVLTSAFDKSFLASHPLTVLPSYDALKRAPAPH